MAWFVGSISRNRSPDWLETALFFDFFEDSPIYYLANGAYSKDDTIYTHSNSKSLKAIFQE
jgi:hypothetical protein